MYEIAFKYGLDYRSVARRNGIHSPYVIYPGQELLLSGRASTKTGMPTQAPQKTTTKSGQAKTQTKAKKIVDDIPDNPIGEWTWPVKGAVITSYESSGGKGIDIAGRLGEPIKAAADGKVVYSGGGLIGYGELIIIKHNKNYLSAYGHNDKLLVKQGDFVKGGQHIASMGHTGTDKVKLHFEIRRDGKPVDPIRYLPK